MAPEITPIEPKLAQTPSSTSFANGDANAHDVEKATRSDDDLSNREPSIRDIEKGPPEPEQSQEHGRRQLVEFDGPNDPDNPKNWGTKKRWLITVSMGMLVFTVTFSSSIFSVNIGVVQEKFDCSGVTATLGVTLFVLVCCALAISVTHQHHISVDWDADLNV